MRGRSALFVLAVVALALGWFALAPITTSVAAPSCPPYELIGARGSGEPQDGEFEGMGAEVHDFYESLKGLVGSGVVKGYGVEYPAVNVKSLDGVGAALHIGFLGKYTDSVREGTKDAEERIRARSAACPSTRFILAGYSQGAQALGKVIENPHLQGLIAAVALFGDPYFNADSWSSRGGDDPGAYGVFGARPEWPAALHGRIFSYCHFHDLICNVSNRHSNPGGTVYVRNPADASISAHITPAYRTTLNGGRGDAGYAARDVARALGFTPSPLPFSGPLDVAFVIDSTGSMSDEIESVKENVATLVGQIAAIDPDYRVALVDYKDEPEEDSLYQSRLDSDFTTNVATFDAAVGRLEADGGGDTPESVYSGLLTALDLAWRPGAKKVVVQIGDAPAKDPEPVTGLTLRAIQAKALSLDPATVDTIEVGEDLEAGPSFQNIAAATGGQYLALPEDQIAALVPSIANEVRRNTIAPAATLTAPSRAIVGQPVTLSAGESHDVGEAIVGYDWDLNGDGVFDVSSTDPVVSYTYPAPYSGPVAVRVRSASGLSSLAAASLSVVPLAATAPGRPRHLRGRLDGKSLVLTWHAGRAAPAAWFTILDRKRHVVERLPAEEAAGAKGFEATISGLKPGGRYTFSVAAGSDGGESKPAGPILVGGRKHPHHRRTGDNPGHGKKRHEHGGKADGPGQQHG